MRANPENLVYFIKPIGLPGPIKIGCSHAPEQRIENLAAWSPWPLEIMVTVPGDGKLERKIHDRFARHHSHKEWFHGHVDILTAVEKLKAGVPVTEAIDLNIKTGSIRTQAERHKHTPESRIKAAYRMRLWWAQRRRKQSGASLIWAPIDVDRIIGAWRPELGRLPSDAEMKRLDQVLADPDAHFISQAERFPKFVKAAA